MNLVEYKTPVDFRQLKIGDILKTKEYVYCKEHSNQLVRIINIYRCNEFHCMNCKSNGVFIAAEWITIDKLSFLTPLNPVTCNSEFVIPNGTEIDYT